MGNKLRIAIVTPFGAEPRLDHFAEFILVKGLLALGHNARLYTYRRRDHELYRRNLIYQSVPVFRCRQRAGLAPGLVISLLRFRPDCVLYFHPKSRLSFSAYLGAKLAGAKTISEIVGILHDPFLVGDTDDPVTTLRPKAKLLTSWGELVRALFGSPSQSWQNFVVHMPVAKADVIVAINQDEQEYIKKFYHRDSKLIHWAIPQATRPKTTKPEEKKYGRLPERFLLFIAQVKKRKGWDTVLEALEILKNQGTERNLVFVCPHQDVSEANTYARNLGVEAQIYFLSGVSNEEKNWLYQNCDMVLAPSRYEGFGLPVFEALAAGKPALTTDLPVYQELLTHGSDALISGVGDSAALAANIKALDGDPALAKQLIQGGYQTVAKFTDELMVNKFVALIKSVLAKAD